MYVLTHEEMESFQIKADKIGKLAKAEKGKVYKYVVEMQ
jgi:hypothetical protein